MSDESATAQLLALIEASATKGIRSDVLGEKLGIASPVVTALLAPKVKNGTLVMCKVVNPGTGREMNEYRTSVVAGGKMHDGLSAAVPGRPPKKADLVLERMRDSGLRGNGEDKTEPAAPKAAPEIPVLADVKPPAGAPNVRGDAKRQRVASDVRPEIPAPRPARNGTARIGAIEKDIPLPFSVGELRQAFEKMRIGNSRLIAGYNKSNIHNAASRSNVAIVLRPERDGFRVWRVAPEKARKR